MARFDLSDEEWAIIAPLLPKQGRGPGRCDDRKILNGMFYILREPVRRGAICRSAMVRTRPSITDMYDGAGAGSGRRYSMRLHIKMKTA